MLLIICKYQSCKLDDMICRTFYHFPINIVHLTPESILYMLPFSNWKIVYMCFIIVHAKYFPLFKIKHEYLVTIKKKSVNNSTKNNHKIVKRTNKIIYPSRDGKYTQTRGAHPHPHNLPIHIIIYPSTTGRKKNYFKKYIY
jgi:hypothetical protein